MKRIEVSQKVYDSFEDYRGKRDDSPALASLLRAHVSQTEARAERIAVVMLEDLWAGFDENPGQMSNAPFLEGVCRLVDKLKCYRLNFYDASSLRHALDAMASVSEQRVILYIGAHGSKGKIGKAHASTLMKSIAAFSAKKKTEGVFLSSCSVGANDDALSEAFKGGINWMFAYTSEVDFLGSVQVETAILERLGHVDADTVGHEDRLAEVFAAGLNRFNPAWEIGSAPRAQLRDAIRLVTRGKHMKKPVEKTGDLRKLLGW